MFALTCLITFSAYPGHPLFLLLSPYRDAFEMGMIFAESPVIQFMLYARCGHYNIRFCSSLGRAWLRDAQEPRDYDRSRKVETLTHR